MTSAAFRPVHTLAVEIATRRLSPVHLVVAHCAHRASGTQAARFHFRLALPILG